MKHYRINKVVERGGKVLKKKDIFARDDEQALERARNDDDCPICEVFEAGKPIGAVDQP